MLSRILKSLLLSILVCITLSANDSGSRLITPEHFDWMAETSINVMQAYRNMNDMIDAVQPTILFFYFDMIRPLHSDFQIPTTLGNVSVMPIEGRAYFYFRWPFIEDKEYSFLLLINALNLSSDLDLNPEKEDYYSELYWNNGNNIIAGRYSPSKKLQITAGVQSHIYPTEEIDSSQTRLFSVYFDEEDSVYRGTDTSPQLFLHLDYLGYDFGTIYSPEKNAIQLLELIKYFTLGDLRGRIGAGFNYYRFLNTYQLGLRFLDFPRIRNTLAGLNTYWNLHKDRQWNALSYLSLESSTYLLKDRETVRNATKKLFHITMDLGASYSTDVFEDPLIGYKIECHLKNIKIPTQKNELFADFGIGISQNYHHNIVRLPFQDDVLLRVWIKSSFP